MLRHASVFALVLFTSFSAFAQAPALPGSAAASADRMKAAAATTATQAKTTATTEGAKADTAATDTAKAGAKAGDAAATKAKGAGAKLLDLNSATVDEIKAIPALSSVADKIVAARPFANKSQLVSKKILDKATYAQVKDLVVAHKAK
ncbi:MAG TPA: helix-hairpin-helix domain-containing protein [Polyangia bacterium]|jgi:DNA uptake protein ComE-like DNA-binding protein